MPSRAPTFVQQTEAERLRILLAYEVLDTPPDAAMTDIVRLAAQITGAPCAYIGFIDAARVWFKARVGLIEPQVPRSLSACQFTMLEPHALVIDDAADDERFPDDRFPNDRFNDRLNDDPFPDDRFQDARFPARPVPISYNLGCRSYAGAPLITQSGAVLGTVAVLSPAPYAFSELHASQLEVLARQVVTRLELHHAAALHERTVRARQRIERALTVERNFVSAVLDTIGALVLVLDTAGRIVRFNRACERISGYQFSELVGRTFPDELFLPEERESFDRFLEQACAEPVAESFEVHWVSREGKHHRIDWTLATLLDNQDEPSFIIATGVDVTEQREAETALRSSEARYRQLVEGSLGMVCTHDLEGRLLSINTHAAESMGYSVEELVGRRIFDLIPEEHRSGYADYAKGLEAAGEMQGLLHLSHRDGRTLVIAYRNKLLLLPDEAPFVLGHGIDITEKTNAEEKLLVLMRQHESILDSVGDGIYGMDLNGRVVFVNEAGAALCGYTPEEVEGKDLHALIHHSYADNSAYPVSECPIRNSVARRTPTRGRDEVFWHKDGTSFPVEFVACPLINDGKVTGIVLAFQDISERRRLDRMKDEFISTVSHELRTPLTSLRAALGLIAGGSLKSRPEKVEKMLDVAVGNSDRLVRLVNDILDFERIGSGKLALVSTVCTAEDILNRATELQRGSASKAGIRFRIEAGDVDLYVDTDRILQTLANLIGNAIKFSPRGSELLLRAEALDENEALITVEDHGRGIAPEKIGIIFERFQQADASDSRAMGGTGLGLAICRSIVTQHGGRIWVESTPGVGSKFLFTVPRAKAAAVVESSSQAVEVG